MLKGDASLLQAIVNLSGNKDFDVFYRWIRDSYSELARAFVLDLKSPDSLHRIEQGRAMNCYQIKTKIDTAGQQLRDLKDKKETG